MTHTPVKSSNLASVAYDPARRLLEIRFQRSGTYRYYDVPPEVHVDLIGAPSAGTYFAANIKGRFQCKKF